MFIVYNDEFVFIMNKRGFVLIKAAPAELKISKCHVIWNSYVEELTRVKNMHIHARTRTRTRTLTGNMPLCVLIMLIIEKKKEKKKKKRNNQEPSISLFVCATRFGSSPPSRPPPTHTYLFCLAVIYQPIYA